MSSNRSNHNNDSSLPDVSAKKLQSNVDNRVQEILIRHKEYENLAIEDMQKLDVSLKSDLKDLPRVLSANVGTLIKLLHGTGELTALYYLPLIYVVSIQEQYLLLEAKVAYYQLFFEANKKTIVTTHFLTYKALITEIDETANLLEQTMEKLNKALEDCKQKQNFVLALHNKFSEIDKKNNQAYEEHSKVSQPATLSQIPEHAKELSKAKYLELLNEKCRKVHGFVSLLFDTDKNVGRFKMDENNNIVAMYDCGDADTKRLANKSIVSARSAVAFFKQVEKRVNTVKSNPPVNTSILCN